MVGMRVRVAIFVCKYLISRELKRISKNSEEFMFCPRKTKKLKKIFLFPLIWVNWNRELKLIINLIYRLL